jgi:hypothetical protein
MERVGWEGRNSAQRVVEPHKKKKSAGGCSEVWRALVSLVSCMFKVSQYGAPLQINVLSVVCYCAGHYHSYIPWHTRLRISCFCDVTLTHPCTVYTWHKRCVYVLSISFLCDVTLTHPCTVYTWHKRCVYVLSISFTLWCHIDTSTVCTWQIMDNMLLCSAEVASEFLSLGN